MVVLLLFDLFLVKSLAELLNFAPLVSRDVRGDVFDDLTARHMIRQHLVDILVVRHGRGAVVWEASMVVLPLRTQNVRLFQPFKLLVVQRLVLEVISSHVRLRFVSISRSHHALRLLSQFAGRVLNSDSLLLLTHSLLQHLGQVSVALFVIFDCLATLLRGEGYLRATGGPPLRPSQILLAVCG